jgi:hypothetical protein
MESSELLCRRVLTNSIRDLQFQLARLAGSLSVIGSPVGLIKNIGGGVQAFFYEVCISTILLSQFWSYSHNLPCSPHTHFGSRIWELLKRVHKSLFLGIGKGTTSLVGGIIGGALNSSADVIMTATQGISQVSVMISCDESFRVHRSEKRRLAHEAAHEGVMSGLLEGGSSIILGIFNGVTGIISRPIEGGCKNGPIGVMHGLGLGIVGLGVSPLLGVTDGLNAIAQTIYVQVSDSKYGQAKRPQRALDCVFVEQEPDRPREPGLLSTGLALTLLDLQAAQAQMRILQKAKRKGEQDFFVGFVDLGCGSSVILTTKYIFWKRKVDVPAESVRSRGDAASNPRIDLPIVEVAWKNVEFCYLSHDEQFSVCVTTQRPRSW